MEGRESSDTNPTTPSITPTITTMIILLLLQKESCMTWDGAARCSWCAAAKDLPQVKGITYLLVFAAKLTLNFLAAVVNTLNTQAHSCKKCLNSILKDAQVKRFLIANRGWKANCRFLQNVLKRNSVNGIHLSPHICIACVEWCGIGHYELIYISRVSDRDGVSQAWYIVEIHHSGRKPTICFVFLGLHLHLYLSHSLVDRWGTTVDFTASFLHSSRFSAFRSMIFGIFKAITGKVCLLVVWLLISCWKWVHLNPVL